MRVPAIASGAASAGEEFAAGWAAVSRNSSACA